ncbi:hypothetical protein [Pseudoalteromonas ruthenica]|uniref:hypothetical protein n=1 Tax=Pseudoalteromonas ruthenica TaxID=151081 RepID=UPI000A6B2B17|nr:hypothetical protein [Pseudoalteromonas ruthenica]
MISTWQLARREIKPGLMLHSDRYAQYRAIAYQDLVPLLGRDNQHKPKEQLPGIMR